MELLNTGVLELAERRLAWADQRQRLLAQNVANANTPDYQARDLPPFQALLGRATIPLAATSQLHLAGLTGPLADNERLRPSARAPNGNAVSLDEQLTDIADTDEMHNLAANLYRTYVAMFRTALGQPG